MMLTTEDKQKEHIFQYALFQVVLPGLEPGLY